MILRFLAIAILISSFLFTHIPSANEQDFFQDLTDEQGGDGSVVLSDDSHDDFNFEPFNPDQASSNKVFTYDEFYKGVRPDVGVRIGRRTVDKWSYRFLKGNDLPLRHVKHEIIKDYLSLTITVDHTYFKKRGEVDLVAPAWAPGEVFKDVGDRKVYQQGKTPEDYVFDIRFRLRFPLIGYQNP